MSTEIPEIPAEAYDWLELVARYIQEDGYGAAVETARELAEDTGDGVGGEHPATDRCVDCVSDEEVASALAGRSHPTIHWRGANCGAQDTQGGGTDG
ncbi:hypothetical protein [Actinokineospora sp.]|uniref:hypothetical protein n=1 Tax=Actinokineospora sp. TaxID=1872133 RepID=UPI003D6BA621